ncbi:hypothetical protein APHNP_0342 [Anaplasma phagocytophilum str. ApNP]|uniref:Uncharacterized protein n=2 Tax=Anaplasma phagocytophilum TaxID=948 RepID=A0A0F3NMA3_ANAPH|nr:hypothetical protein APHMUC_0555 [Anaplasma phagocytophilum str. ApMUC09]KJV68029.1 hypothetical protein APHNP_0342 [Anaplasma phagocytophilum str. ApNP]SCV62242.1 hypothetical protein ANAPH2_00235 [Anaplasma phagocytophilum]
MLRVHRCNWPLENCPAGAAPRAVLYGKTIIATKRNTTHSLIIASSLGLQM